MSAITNKRAVIVGIFTLVGLLIFFASILILGGKQKTFVKKVKVKAVFLNVGGLKEGNNVWFSGVKVGTVYKMQFLDNSRVEVTMNISEEVHKYIRSNAKARISSEGFIGNKIVEIVGGTSSMPIVNENETLGVEEAFNVDEIKATLQENNLNLLAITHDFKEISKKITEGQGTIGKLMTDETLFNSLEAISKNLLQTSVNAQNLTSNLSNYSSKFYTKGSFANDLIADTVIFHRLKAASLQIETVAGAANDVVNDLKKATNSLSGSNTPLGTLLNDKEAAENLKITLRNLQSGTEKLDENMEALQHNFLLRGFFKKKAKKEAGQPVNAPEAKNINTEKQNATISGNEN